MKLDELLKIFFDTNGINVTRVDHEEHQPTLFLSLA